MAEQRRTTTKIEYKDGKKIVTTISVVITEDDRLDGRSALQRSAMTLSRTTAASPQATRRVQKAVLERHNFYRAKHGIAPLQWNPEDRNQTFKNSQSVF